MSLACPTSPARLIRRGLLVTVLAFARVSAGLAQSPFALNLESAAVAPGHVDVRITVSVPERHVIYADTFKVTAGADAVAERVATNSVMAGHFIHEMGVPADRVHTILGGVDEAVFRFDAAGGRFVTDGGAGDAQRPTPGAQPSAWSQGLAVTAGGGYMGVEEFLAFLDRAEGDPRPSGVSAAGLSGFLSDPVAFFHARGWALTLLLVLVGGVLLNLTPCVLPMMPINLAIIGAGAGTRGRGFFLGAAYGAGIVLVYGGLGWLILRSGLFFGALQASPWFSLAVALIFVALALALFDVFVIDFTRFTSTRGNTRQGTFAAFSAGALSALLAGACVAPVVLAMLLLAGTLYAGGASSAQLLPFVLGLGMALPWPFAGAGLSVLPKPGMWMVRVKQAFGVFLAVLAAYYFYLAWVGFSPVAHGIREGSILAGDRAAWEDKVAQARREGKPLLVDFWATWCKNCSVMERTTFRDERVKARLSGYVVVKVQAEKPEQSPAKEMLRAFDVRGLPGFAVLREPREAGVGN